MIKKGKLFGKIHIVDILAFVVLVGVIVINVGSFSPAKITSYSQGKVVKIQYEVITYEYSPLVFERLIPGTVLAQDKKYLDGKILDIEILDKVISLVDNNGEIVTAAHPLYKKAHITLEATVLYEDEAYKLGNQEVREGKPYFIITEWNNISAIVTNIEIIEE